MNRPPFYGRRPGERMTPQLRAPSPDRRQVREGDRLRVRPGFGTEPAVTVTVTGIDEHKGRKVIEYTDAEGNGRWAYLDQIVGVVK